MALTTARRRLLDIQGFDQVDGSTLAQTEPWLRMTPALCAMAAAVGTALASPWILWVLAATAVLGAVLPFHPFDLIYNLGIRRITGTPALPANRAPRRFACAMASVWLIATGALFASGINIAGYVLGFALVGVATLVATTHICIPSMIFRTACGQMPSLRTDSP
jgi:uncharacterized protein DUF4395